MELVLASTFVLSFIFISVLIRYALFFGLQDVPNGRSSHKKQMPRSAGFGFVAAALISLLLFNLSHFLDYYYIYLSIFFITLIGLYDDKFDMSHRLKFVLIIFIAIFISYNGINIGSLGTYFGYSLTLPMLIAAPFTVFAIVGFTNALNLMDGLDGLAGGLALIMLVAFFLVGLENSDSFLMTLSSVFATAVVVFLYFNWFPAKIFMGDSGSLSLGFVIAILSIKSLTYITPSAVLFIVALPLIDTFIVMKRRIQRGLSPFVADKNHLHHFIYKTKLHVKFSVILLLAIQLAFSIMGFQMGPDNEILSLLLFGVMLFIFLNLFDQRFRYRGPKKKKKKSEKLSIKGTVTTKEEVVAND
jgi:UDP-GlcNAc:undecaprenyl-phosphate GlcNAc-1-phosphate transferase